MAQQFPANDDFNRRDFLRTLTAAGVATLVGTPASSATTGPAPASDGANADAGNAIRSSSMQKLTPVPVHQVQVKDDFWTPKRRVWQEVTIRDCFTKFENYQTGTLNNFDRVRDGLKGAHAGDPWWDGLIYEMIRGAADFLIGNPDPQLEKQLDGYIERITAAAATNPTGYINTYTQLVEPGHEWGLNGGLQLWQHEIYNLGALIDAGIHYYRATGKAALLVAGVRIANSMCAMMGPSPKKNIVPCHPLPEEVLVRLYELFVDEPSLKARLPLPVNEIEYLHLAEFWIENRGNNIGKPDWEGSNHRLAEQFVRNQEYGAGRPSWGPYAQDEASVFEQKDIHGHAVRATLLCAGIAAAARQNDEPRYRETAVRLWESMVYRRMHITGGVGAFANDEKFGADYTLPNDGYLETCAAAGAGFFHHDMNMAFGDARYIDELERTLYNGALAGVSIKGNRYTYQNPLESEPSKARWSWHDCPCCPPMFLKMMGAMPGYIYATDAESMYVNLFVGGSASIAVNGVDVSIQQITRYPWEGAVRIALNPSQASSFAVMLRIPEWSRGETIAVNGERVDGGKRVRGYMRISRRWQAGDVIELNMPMPVRRVFANPLVLANSGKAVLMRGPIVYCVESIDNAEAIAKLRLVQGAKLSATYNPDLLGGVVAVTGTVSVQNPSTQGLYTEIPQDKYENATLTAIPFYANCNRGPAHMAVWLPDKT